MTTPTTGAAELPEALRLADLLLALQTHLGPRRDEKDPDEQAAWDGYTDAAACLRSLHAQVEALSAAQAGVPADPMDWPLPCDVTVGHGTMCKGVSLRTLVTRMKVLYEMATGNNADEVANRTPEQRTALADAFRASIAAAPQPSPSPAPAQPAPAPTADALRTARAYIKWHAFGECRADGWTGRPPDAAETVELLDAAIAAHQGDTQ